MSFLNLKLKVKRPEEITVEYQNAYGDILNEHLNGIEARCFLHELDHLDGICFTDRVSKMTLSMARKKREKREKREREN